MKDLTELNPLMLELLEDNTEWKDGNVVFTDRGLELIDEISDFAEHTRIFQENKEKGEVFDDSTAQLLFGYMLDRVANAPTAIHRNLSIILIMPFLRQRLREERSGQHNG